MNYTQQKQGIKMKGHEIKEEEIGEEHIVTLIVMISKSFEINYTR